MRVHGFSRFVRPADYLDILPNVQHVFVWAKEIRPLAGGLGVTVPEGWRPAGVDATLEGCAQALGTHAGRRRLVAFAIDRTAYVFAPERGFASFAVPEGERLAISDTRLHGALLAYGLGVDGYVPATVRELIALGDRALQASYCGYDETPEGHPGRDCALGSSWQSGACGPATDATRLAR